MNLGMLWHDDDKKRTPSDKVLRACNHYQQKYGAFPTVCVVNPVLATFLPARVGHVVIRQARTVLPDHFWVGVED